MATARLRCGTVAANLFWTVHAVAGHGWHRGRQGTEWHRVSLEIQLSGSYLPANRTPVGSDLNCQPGLSTDSSFLLLVVLLFVLILVKVYP